MKMVWAAPAPAATSTASMPNPKRKSSALIFWQQHKAEMPHLYQLVLKYLAVPNSSVYSERLFSQAGNIYEAKRSKLRAEISENLLFLQNNYPHL